MIEFINNSSEIPYLLFKKKYDVACDANQNAIEAISISSYSKDSQEVNSRYVNLKIIDNNDFIFFSNYKSPKSIEFKSHKQISALIYWDSIDIQIRMKANICKTDPNFNNIYFSKRSVKKNALAISSNQSEFINSYDDVLINYKKALNSSDLRTCPDYWGGFKFKPYYFEFWEGHDLRLNKRDIYKMTNNRWQHSVIQP